MRKIILVAAMVLASASAQAGDRSLSLSAAPEQASAQPATMATAATTQMCEVTPATAAPKYIDRPPVVPAIAPVAATAPAAITATPAPAPTAKTMARAGNAKRKHTLKHTWTERRIVSELHRHGIYW